MKPIKLSAESLSTQLKWGEQLLQLRPLTSSDLEAVHRIECSAHTHPWSRQLFEDCLNSHQHCLVLCLEQRIVCYCVISAAGGDAELLNITTAPQWQGRGLARLTLSYLQSRLKAFADTLYLEVRKSNTRAINLYQELGFAELGIRANYYPADKGREDAIIMACPLAL